MADNGEPIEAVRQSILAGDLDAGRTTLLAVIPLILSVERSGAGRGDRTVGPDGGRSNPTLSALLASAAVHYHRHRVAAMLQDARGGPRIPR